MVVSCEEQVPIFTEVCSMDHCTRKRVAYYTPVRIQAEHEVKICVESDLLSVVFFCVLSVHHSPPQSCYIQTQTPLNGPMGEE